MDGEARIERSTLRHASSLSVFTRTREEPAPINTQNVFNVTPPCIKLNHFSPLFHFFCHPGQGYAACKWRPVVLRADARFLYLIVTAGVGMQMRIGPSSLCKSKRREDQDSACTYAEHGLTARRIAWFSSLLSNKSVGSGRNIMTLEEKRSLEMPINAEKNLRSPLSVVSPLLIPTCNAKSSKSPYISLSLITFLVGLVRRPHYPPS